MNREAKVGLFVITAILIFVATFISVANVQLGGNRVTYRTYFKFAGGLDRGNLVRFGGRKAGVVAEVGAWPDDPTLTQVVFEVREDVPITKDATATIASLSALGQNYLEIRPGTMAAGRLEPGGVVESEEAVSLNDVTRMVADVAQTAVDVMTSLQKDVDLITLDVRAVLSNVEELTGEANQKNIESLLTNANKLMEEQGPKFDEITTKVNSAMEKVDRLLEDLRHVAQNADETVSNVNRTVEETREPIKRDLAELEAALTEARTLLKDIRGVVAVNEYNINETLENFRIASQNIEQFTDEIRQRPWSLLRVKPKEDRQVPVPVPR